MCVEHHPSARKADIARFTSTEATAVAMCKSVKSEQWSKEQEATTHLLGRLRGATDKKRKELELQFGLVDDKFPKTMQELVDRIQKGQFVLTDKGKARDKLACDNTRVWLGDLEDKELFRFRDPKKAEDKEGFEAAIKRRDEAYTKAMSIILVKSPEEGLAAVEDFEKQSFWS